VAICQNSEPKLPRSGISLIVRIGKGSDLEGPFSKSTPTTGTFEKGEQ